MINTEIRANLFPPTIKVCRSGRILTRDFGLEFTLVERDPSKTEPTVTEPIVALLSSR